MTIHLTKPMTFKGAEVSELALDFEAFTGADLVAAKSEVCVMRDNTPVIAASMRYPTAMAVCMIGCPADDVIAMPAVAFKAVIARVMCFFMA